MFSCLFHAAAWVWTTWGGTWLRISRILILRPYPLLVSKWSAGILPNQVWKKRGWHEERKSTGERECCRMINKKGKGNRERRCGEEKDLGALKEIRDRKMCAVADLGRLLKTKAENLNCGTSLLSFISLCHSKNCLWQEGEDDKRREQEWKHTVRLLRWLLNLSFCAPQSFLPRYLCGQATWRRLISACSNDSSSR